MLSTETERLSCQIKATFKVRGMHSPYMVELCWMALKKQSQFGVLTASSSSSSFSCGMLKQACQMGIPEHEVSDVPTHCTAQHMPGCKCCLLMIKRVCNILCPGQERDACWHMLAPACTLAQLIQEN